MCAAEVRRWRRNGDRRRVSGTSMQRRWPWEIKSGGSGARCAGGVDGTGGRLKKRADTVGCK